MMTAPRVGSHAQSRHEMPRGRYSTVSDATMVDWIVGLHVSACRRWLMLEPVPLKEVARTLSVILESLKLLEPVVGTQFEGDAPCPFIDGREIREMDRQSSLDVLADIEAYRLRAHHSI